MRLLLRTALSVLKKITPPENFIAGERICPPRAGSGGNAMLRAYVVIFIALGGGWALLGKQSNWQGWASAETAVVSPFVDRVTPAAAPNVRPANRRHRRNNPPSSHRPRHCNHWRLKEIAAAPGDAVQSRRKRCRLLATPAATDELRRPQPCHHQRPTPPTLIKCVRRQSAFIRIYRESCLAKLSPADYRNAGIAIQTAVAKTPDNGVFIWPRQRKPDLALFEVHFVPGAAPDCRRYVVTVTKDGWSTTALPMEKCGSNPAARRSG